MHDANRTARRVARRLRGYPRRALPLDGHRPASVTVPLVRDGAGVSVLLTVRAEDLEQHRGEVAFPGGRPEPGDASSLHTALRETWEEVGIRPGHLKVLGALDDMVSVTGYRVTPHVVYLDRPGYPLRPEPSEVASILMVPLAHLCDPAHHRLDGSRPGRGTVHEFRWGPHRVWGLTAAILHRFLVVAFDFETSP